MSEPTKTRAPRKTIVLDRVDSMGLMVRRVRRQILARRGAFMIHRSIGTDGPGYTVTHEPTRYAAVYGLSWSMARRALRDFAALPGRWDFTDPHVMSARQKIAGRRLRARYMSKAEGR